MWWWTKNKTIDELIKINKIIDMHSRRLSSQLEELDQKKVYVCKLPGASKEELETAKQAFNDTARNMKWTMPKIIFLNADFKEEPKKGSVKK